ncbi:MAG: EcoRV family type II restriction endonuclease [Treponema sp.]|jgi:hypothetical protein|nr:EcoRV family type II restriction endonuclease [Treponema sp.]
MRALLIAYRLHLTGYRKIESDNDMPPDYSAVKDDDPYPVTVFGLTKPVSSNKIGGFLNDTFYHYLRIYKNTKNHGLPYKSWFDAPHWLLDLIDRFDAVAEEYARYKLSKGLV